MEIQAVSQPEHVKLPEFVGDEKCSPWPFLSFPIWLKQWKGVIEDYEAKYRDRLLCDKLDSSALAKITGFENDYDEAMKRLEQYYGDSSKVIKCVVKQVRDPDSLSENDYRGLVEYSTVLEHNYNRLTSMNLEHEMSNHSIMSIIVKKFPCSIEERWHDHILDKSEEEKAKPFPVFIKWLSRQKEKWACMVSPEIEGGEVSFYGEDSRPAKECFGCGETGHIRKFCPKNKSNSGGGSSKPRKTVSVKKFWCTLHKDEKLCR